MSFQAFSSFLPLSGIQIPPSMGWVERFLFWCLFFQFLSLCFFFFFFFFCFVFFFFLGSHQQHMEIPRLGVKSELWLPAYTTAIAMWDLSCICNLYHSLWQCWIPNPFIEARDRTRILLNPSLLSTEPLKELPSLSFSLRMSPVMISVCGSLFILISA